MNKTDWINVSAVAVLTAAEFVLLISVALFVAAFIEKYELRCRSLVFSGFAGIYHIAGIPKGFP